VNQEINSNPIVSIIMPTFNSASTIEVSLRSIREQDYSQDRIEVLIIDGGSTDITLQIGDQWGARIIENPYKLPEYAKHIGLLSAKGNLAIFLDSDESFESPTAISRRVMALLDNREARVVVSGGYLNPAGAGSINDYIIAFSDPFAWFVYRSPTDCRGRMKSWSKRFRNELVGEDSDALVFEFANNSEIPLVDFCAGGTLDLDWLRKVFAMQLDNPLIVPRLFGLIAKSGNTIVLLKNDSILHDSSDSIIRYIRKLYWRCIANTNFSDLPSVGFSNQLELMPRYQRIRKYLFVIYAASILGPIFDSIVQFVRTRKVATLLHAPLTILVLILILYGLACRVLGIKLIIGAYGKEGS
jgi:glycosyltransferase involved in cell wall biosynthesis